MSWSTISKLLWKNFLVFKAHRNKYLTIYISPLLILLMLMILQAWTQSNFTWQNNDPVQKTINPIPKCYGQECLTIGVVIQGQRKPYMDTVISKLKQFNNFDKDDIKQLQINAQGINPYLLSNPNKTQFIILFCSDSHIQFDNYTVPCYADEYNLNFYTIVYNLSLYHTVPYMSNLKQNYPKDYVTIKLKYDIDRAIIQHYNPQAKVELNFTDMPGRTSRFVQGVSIVAQHGSFFFMIPFLALLVMEGGRLLVQKEKRLRIGLNIIGVTHRQFYAAQLISYLLHVTVLSTVFCVFGWILDFKFFSRGIFIFDLLVLITNGMVLGLLAFCITAAVTQRGLGMSILYGFVLYSIVMQWMFSGGILFDLMYFTNASPVVVSLRYLFNAYPSFHFSKIVSDVHRLADSHMDTYQNRFVQGTQFAWKDVFVRQSKSYEKPFPQSYILPSPGQSAIYMILTSITFFLALWLLDNLVESNRGYRQSLNPCLRRKRRNSQYFNQQHSNQKLVDITNLQKRYNNDVFALNGVTAHLLKGQIVALLGQNGAGKSTLINIVIGALAKTRGRAIIDGIQVQEDITAIRKIIGVCPQFDILWQELTAGQHVRLFYELKGIGVDRETVFRCLQTVSLQKNVDGKVSTFSGGMRRRLSLALSLIGDPKLVILDEPTTGMDAKVRLNTWKLILSLRGSHTVLITTHNMQQAECVSDRIMIMSKGRVIAQGSATQLKKNYGQGYVIRGYDRAKNQEKVIRCQQSELQAKLNQLQGGQLENWSLQETTLQEVFLSVSHRF